MDKYSIVRMAGRGAYGTVYLAKRNTDGKEVWVLGLHCSFVFSPR